MFFQKNRLTNKKYDAIDTSEDQFSDLKKNHTVKISQNQKIWR